jgi:hypothetical protein
MIRELVRQYIDDNCIFRCDPDVQYTQTLEPGFIYPQQVAKSGGWRTQFFLRKLLFDPNISHYVGSLFTELLPDLDDQYQLCAIESGGTPLAMLIQSYHARSEQKVINLFSVRKERKASGLFNMIEGTPNDLPVVYVDDLVNSGRSADKAIWAAFNECGVSSHHMCPLVTLVAPANHEFWIKSVFEKTEFNFKFEKEKYWLPKDVDLIK